ncbi:MAG: ketoacyl-ACP synthase III [Actinomycetia bacterium]|nr:ketoacyl-ACP synthase III [Actinomycetes bacterium]MCP3910135.1 ketoacyl-ACP synthase III [Actinomycetes bacterium]MCP4085131.1 ketoacyl-ACP synthase III [Actinomycetes bacterium]
MRGARITGWGIAMPPEVVTNFDLEDKMDTTDQWIRERTGIGARHVGGMTSDLAAEAGRQAMKKADATPDSIDMVLLATTSPDQTCPGTAPTVQDELGLDCGALDIQAACSGWVYGLITAHAFIQMGMNKVLVIGAESLSRITDYTDRGTGILFGDGAGATVVEACEGPGELLGWDMGSDGAYSHILYADPGDTLKMDGKEVFRQAVKAMIRSTNAALDMAGLTPDDIDHVIPHQANIRIVESAWKKLGFTLEQTTMVLERTGNTSSASIPLALNDALAHGRIKKGDKVLLLGFGAGMTWASAIVDWQAET